MQIQDAQDDEASRGKAARPSESGGVGRGRGRKRAVRGRTVSVASMPQYEIESGRVCYPNRGRELPLTRGDCADGVRPCPYVSCRYNLYLDVEPGSCSYKTNFPNREVWEMKASCALDVANEEGATTEEVGALMNLTAERVRQLEVKGLAKIKALRGKLNLRECLEEGTVDKRRLPVLTASELAAAEQLSSQ